MHGRTDEDTDFVEFDLMDINYIDLWSPTRNSAKVPAYHTFHGSYLALFTIVDISKGYRSYGFLAFDRSTVINLKNIKDLVPHKNGTKVIFRDNSFVIVRKNYENINVNTLKPHFNPRNIT